MKVLIFTKYGSQAASTRYRFAQYLTKMKSCGIEAEISPLLDDAYLKEKFTSGKTKLSFVVGAFFRRMCTLMFAQKYDKFVVYAELFPYFPPIFEYFLKCTGKKYLYEFDDAFFHQYDKHSNFLVRALLKNKISRIIKWSSGVIAGNEYLANYARKYNQNVTIIPTVVDIHKFESPHSLQAENKIFTIGWIGSPSTSKYVLDRSSLFQTMAKKLNFRLVLIGSGLVNIPGVETDVKDWSEFSEIDEIRKFDVGIMPLSQDPWSQGKCGFKLLQYMACKIPVVASPVGVNSSIVQHGIEGFLAESDEEWISAFVELNSKNDLRHAMGTRGYSKVSKEYSLQAVESKLIRFYLDSN